MSAFQASLQKIFVECLEAILRPIVKLTLHSGLGHSEFSAAVRRVFIDVASVEYGVRGRPANIAKIAAKTGLPRKVIQRYRAQTEEQNWTPDEEISPLNTLIHYWRYDERFCKEPGSPRDLPFDGDNSFTTLVKGCVGDIPVTTIRQELINEDLASLTEEGLIHLERDYSFPDRIDEDFLRNAAFSISYHVETLFHNATLVGKEDISVSDHLAEGKFERFVWSRHLDATEVAQLQQWARTEGTKFILEAESYVSSLELAAANAEDDDRVVAGIGLYYFSD